MNKKAPTLIIGFLSLIAGIAFFSQANFASAIDYVPLAPLPGTTVGTCDPADPSYINNPRCKVDFQKYIPAIFTLAIQVAGGLAVVMIIVGGVKYITSASLGGKEDGRETIQNAVIGLLLAIGAYIILYTINPQTLQINLQLNPLTPVSGGGPAPGANQCPANVGGTITVVNCACASPCVDLTQAPYSAIPRKPGIGTQLNKDDADRLLNMIQLSSGSTVKWQITEAFKPQFAHVNQCHIMGTCTDANIVPGISNFSPPGSVPSSQSMTNILLFFQFAEQVGLKAEFEVKTQAEANYLRNVGNIPSKYTIKVVNQITAPHFSMY